MDLCPQTMVFEIDLRRFVIELFIFLVFVMSSSSLLSFGTTGPEYDPWSIGPENEAPPNHTRTLFRSTGLLLRRSWRYRDWPAGNLVCSSLFAFLSLILINYKKKYALSINSVIHITHWKVTLKIWCLSNRNYLIWTARASNFYVRFFLSFSSL